MSNFKQKAVTFFEPDGSLDMFFKNIDQAVAAGAKSLLLLSADENNFDEGAINDKLKTIPVPVFGGIFPQIIYKNDGYKHGSIVCGLDLGVETICVKGLSNSDTDYEQQITTFAKKTREYSTMMIFVDGNSKYIAVLIEKIYELFGDEISYLGGGAGTMELKVKPCLFSNQGLLADGAQLIAIDHQALISVEHGWKKFAGPFVITESEHNIVKMIDYHPAFEAYKKCVENDGTYKLKEDNFFDIAKSHPLGIEKIDGTFIVRDPIIKHDNDLVCVGEVPENSVVYVLKGTKKALITVAGKAGRTIAQNLKGFGPHYPAIIFDCISRSLILQEDFSKELNTININLPSNLPDLIGASTIGEIANYGNFCLEFYNKTDLTPKKWTLALAHYH